MTKVQIGFRTQLCIPSGWDAFVFNGIVYRQDDAGRWVTADVFAKKSLARNG